MGRLSENSGFSGGNVQGVGGLPDFIPANQGGNRINFLLGTAVPVGAAPWILVGALTVPQTTLLGVASVAGVFDNVAYAELKANGGLADEFNQTVANTLLLDSGFLTPINSVVIPAGGGTLAVSVTPDGRFLYSADPTIPTSIDGFTINQATGALASMGAAFVGQDANPNGIAATNKFVYVANASVPPNASILTFKINQVTGALTLQAPVVENPQRADCMCIDPTGKFLFVAGFTGTSDITSYINDPVTGIPAVVGTVATGAGTAPIGVCTDSTGKFCYTANTDGTVSGFTVNPVTGALVSVGVNVASGEVACVRITASAGLVYVTTGANNVRGFTINPATGVLTNTGVAIAGGSSGITINFGQIVYACDTTTNNLHVYRADPITGILTLIQTIAGNNHLFCIGSSNGNFLFTSDNTRCSAFNILKATLNTLFASVDITTVAAVIAGAASPLCRVGFRATGVNPFDVSVDFNPSTGNVAATTGNPTFTITPQIVTVDSLTGDPVFRVVIAHPAADNVTFTPYVRPRVDGGLVGSVGVGRIQLEGSQQSNAPASEASDFIPTYETIAARISGRIPSNNSAAAWDIRTLIQATDLSATQIDFTRTLCLCNGTWQLTLPDALNPDIQPYLQGCQIKIVNDGAGVITIAQKNAGSLIFGPGLAQAGQANFTLPYNGAATGLYNVSGVMLQLDSTQQWRIVDTDETHGQQTFLTNGNFTCPAGVTSIWIDGTAAGGGGGGSAATGIGGGGSGGEAVKDQRFAVIPGTVYPIVIGVGGAGGAAGANNGVAGGNSSFDGATLVLLGGNPGFGAAAGVAALGGVSVGRGSGAGKFGSLADGVGGDGGGTVFAPPNIANDTLAGVTGKNYGGGGSGAGATGGAGGQGAGNNVVGAGGAYITVKW